MNNNTDNINYRIEFINKLLKNTNFESMVDLNNTDTEVFESKSTINDIRTLIPKKKYDFNHIISNIGGKLLYIKSGSTGHTFKSIFPTENTEINYAVKVVAYPKRDNYGNVYNKKRPENAEIMMLKTLSYFVLNNQTPHIVLPIATFYTALQPFTTLSKSNIVNNKKYEQFLEKYKENEFYTDASILISEWANGGDLLDYLRKSSNKLTTKEWRVIFFQIISVLAVIQKKYPSFRHNDLKANNVLIQKISINNNKNTQFKYKINNKEFYVPNIGLQIKLWDFDFASIPGIVENDKVSAEWTNRINVDNKKNQYYDLHYFFNTLTRKGFISDFWDSKNISNKVKEFIKRIVPTKYREGDNIAERGRLLLDIEYTTPDKILRDDPFFDKMRPLNSKLVKK